MRRWIVLPLALGLMPAPAGAAHVGTPFLVAAHRGGRAIAPENTLGAFRLSQATWGAQGIWLEMDVHLTADLVPVVIHDADLSRTTTCSGFVHERTVAELAGCDASESFAAWTAFEPIPTLAAVLDEGCEAGWRLMIEIKDVPTEPDFDATGQEKARAIIADIASQQDCAASTWATRILFQSFWPPVLDHLELAAPEFPTILLTTSDLFDGVGFPAVSNVAYATARGYEVSAPDHEAGIDETLVDLAHAANKRVIPWTVNQAARIDELRALGVDGVITDDPALAY